MLVNSIFCYQLQYCPDEIAFVSCANNNTMNNQATFFEELFVMGEIEKWFNGGGAGWTSDGPFACSRVRPVSVPCLSERPSSHREHRTPYP
jgi:hypothetical protein